MPGRIQAGLTIPHSHPRSLELQGLWGKGKRRGRDTEDPEVPEADIASQSLIRTKEKPEAWALGTQLPCWLLFGSFKKLMNLIRFDGIHLMPVLGYL